MRLICPVCGKPLVRNGNSAVCENRHSFDYARSGYLNLLLKSSQTTGDDRDMAAARTRFLETGAYSFLRDEISRLLPGKGVVSDLGCGEGYYTSAFQADEKYGFDLSKSALTHAAKTDPSTMYVLASIFHLPLPDHCTDAALTCFAPAASSEILRILKPGGFFLHVTPGPRHLYEMKEVLYDTPYLNPDKKIPYLLKHADAVTAVRKFHADRNMLRDLFMMTPYAYRTGEAGIARLSKVSEMDITAEFVIHIYTPQQELPGRQVY
ncbi:MAG: methyltransferase domain-containing protein [Solobacterium sp.]|nr:methyltransferase domain-containing protein [Erysipelotrichaceae bacterium]MBQ9154716.1 methyltransferase domain-containing protein [Solobacterium sp.]